MQARLPLAYLLLAIAGALLPWHYNLQFFDSGGSVAPAAFFGAAFANALTTAITLDVYLAAATFALWVSVDARRQGLPHGWLHVCACFAIGLAFALPLYLALREWRRTPDQPAFSPQPEQQ